MCNNQVFLHIDVQVSECPVSRSVGHCVTLWDSRSHLPGGQFSRVHNPPVSAPTTGGVPLTQGFTTTTRFLEFLECVTHPMYVYILVVITFSFFRSRASTSEYEQLPINCRLFQNTVNLQDKCLFCKKTEIRN